MRNFFSNRQIASVLFVALAARQSTALPIQAQDVAKSLSALRTLNAENAQAIILDVETRASAVKIHDKHGIPAQPLSPPRSRKAKRSAKAKAPDEPTIFEVDAQLVFQPVKTDAERQSLASPSAGWQQPTPVSLASVEDAQFAEDDSPLAYYVDAETWMNDIIDTTVQGRSVSGEGQLA